MRHASGSFTALLILCFVFAPAAADGGEFHFIAPFTVFPTGDDPTGIVLADFDGDGLTDAVTSDRAGGTVSLLRGDGAGGFGPPASFPVGAEPSMLVLGDWNGDTLPDLAVANETGNSLSILLGDGAGGFGSNVERPLGLDCRHVAVGYFNADAVADLVVTHYEADSLTVLLGAGDGGFTQASRFAPLGSPFEAIAGDLNEDGFDDLLVADWSDLVSFWPGNGDGSFGTPSVADTTFVAWGFSLGYIDSDSHLDAVYLGDYELQVRSGNGDGTFGAATVFPLPDAIRNSFIDDLNGDGNPDIGCSLAFSDGAFGGTTSHIGVLLGDGNGAFGPRTDSRIGDVATAILPVDLDGDGILDIASASAGGYEAPGSVCVAMGNGDGSFGTPNHRASVPRGMGLALFDADGDTHLDLVTMGNGGCEFFFTPRLRTEPGDGAGNWGAPIAESTANNCARSMTVGDFNHDSAVDIVDIAYYNSQVWLRPGNGDGSFGAPTGFSAGTRLAAVVTAFLNADSHPDLILTNPEDGAVSVLLGQGDGSFGIRQTYGAGPSPTEAAAGDATGDGLVDVVVSSGSLDQISLLPGAGDGILGPRVDYATGSGPTGLAVGDVTGDGRPDVVVGHYDGTTVGLFAGRPDGALDPRVDLPTGPLPTLVRIADVNVDGIPDILTVNESSSVSVLLGLGGGSFAPPASYGVGNLPLDVAIADIDEDGFPEILTIDYYSTTISTLKSNLASIGDTLPPAPPAASRIASIRPNPVAGRLTATYELREAAAIDLEVLDARGRLVAVIERGVREAGPRAVEWAPPAGLRSGVYFMRLRFGAGSTARKFVLVR